MNREEKFSYYKGYEENDELSDEEDEMRMSSDEETEKEFMSYLKRGADRVKEPSKKQMAEKFENAMDKELEDLVKIEEKKFSEENEKKGDTSSKETHAKKENLSEKEYEEDEDTDSELELETGVRCTKKRPKFTNEELFYDPEMDELDERWMNKQRKTCKKIVSPLVKKNDTAVTKESPSTSKKEITQTTQTTYTDAKTDAILNCPCCMTLLCTDCQRHETFKTQYRAMFVFNCKIKQDEQLKYPIEKFEVGKKKSRSKNRRRTEGEEENGEQKFDLYKPVACEYCGTEIGVYDEKDELYHFFNVLASH